MPDHFGVTEADWRDVTSADPRFAQMCSVAGTDRKMNASNHMSAPSEARKVGDPMSERQDDDQVALPPVVYIPCESTEPTNDQLILEMRQLADGRLALPVYSALDRLVSCLGEQQPWAAVPTGRLEDASHAAPFDVVALDLEVPEQWRKDETEKGGVDSD